VASSDKRQTIRAWLVPQLARLREVLPRKIYAMLAEEPDERSAKMARLTAEPAPLQILPGGAVGYPRAPEDVTAGDNVGPARGAARC